MNVIKNDKNELCKPNLLIIAGPTAVGKTDLSIKLAKALDTEIISADSVQVYKELDIGSAKISREEMQGVKHHLIDVLNPEDDFSVSVFKDMALDAALAINDKGKIPILAGGTGFYIQALLKNVDFSSDGGSDPDVREKYEAIGAKEGCFFLHDMLKEVDEEAAKAIPPENVKRVVRALEYYEITGTKISVHNELEKQKGDFFNVLFIVLTDEREILYNRIDSRVDIMMEQGLLDEVKKLKDMGVPASALSMQSLGYRQLYEYLDGKCSLEEAVYQIKLQTRHFAKRQITWFKREKNVIWINKTDFKHDDDRIYKHCLELVNEHFNI